MAKKTMKKCLRNKKGSILDLIMIGSVLVFFGIVILFGFVISSNVNDKIQSMDEFPTEAKTASSSLVGNYSGVIDNSFLFLTMGLAMVTLIMAAMVRVHPMFIPLFIIALLFVIFLSGVFSNIYQGIAEDSNMVAYADQLTFTTTILEYLPIITGVIGTLLMVVMYKTWQNSQ